MIISHTQDFAYTGSIQSYTISTSGTYQIYSAGAQGGTADVNSGGLGATVIGSMHLYAGTTLNVVVGGYGADSAQGSGGGGGSFVYISSGGVTTLLEAAGGGGGASAGGDPAVDVANPGLVTLGGGAGNGDVAGAGGAGSIAYGGGGAGSFQGGGGGGAGWSQAGYDAASSSSIMGGLGGGSLAAEFVGGSSDQAGEGGFGGGGSGNRLLQSGGGGGGYSGGGGGGNNPGGGGALGGGGGGGGSYIIASATNQTLLSAVRSGNGYAWLDLIAVDSQPSKDLTINGQNFSIQNLSNGGSISTGQGSINLIGNNVNCNGGSAQNNPIGLYNISNLCTGLFNNQSSHTVLNQNISQFINSTTINSGGFSNNFNCSYLSDFQGSSNFSINSHNSNPYITNCLTIINNQGGIQNIDLTNYKGLVIVNNNIHVTGLTNYNDIGLLGSGSCTVSNGNHTVYLMGPNCTVNGGSGITTANLLGTSMNAINIMQQGNNLQIWCDWLGTGSGITNLNNVQRIQCNDGMIAIDTGAGHNAGGIFRLYEAALNRSADQQGMGYWISQMDNGTSLQAVANQFLNSQEFINLYGSSTSSAQYVTALYNNVLGRAPDAAGAAYWINQLQAGANKALILISFSESAEGISHTASQMAHGVQYQQWVQ